MKHPYTIRFEGTNIENLNEMTGEEGILLHALVNRRMSE
jgi:hypothetical protein